MRYVDDRLVLSPTDVTKHLACPHITTLDRQVAEGPLTAPAARDGDLGSTLAATHGERHEQRYLATLRDEGRSVVDIPWPAAGATGSAEAATLAAMQSAADVIHGAVLPDGAVLADGAALADGAVLADGAALADGAVLADGAWGGRADFLLRTGRPSALGAWSYDIADARLARSLKVPALLQMATYADRLAVLQGAPPTHLYVVTGDGQRRPWRLVDVAAYTRRARARLTAALREQRPTEPVPVPHCRQCRWLPRCSQTWAAADDVSQVAFLRSDHRLTLRAAGLGTVAALAAARGPAPRGIGGAAWNRVTGQARLQVDERTTAQPSYRLLDPAPGLGLLRLPDPDPGDLYLDFEGDPFAGDGTGREYLAGIGERDGGFRTIWAHDAAAEAGLVCDLVDRLLERWRAHPGMHVYHYAAYETSVLKRLTGRYAVREAELDQLLRGGRFVDLYTVVRQGLQLSKASYSLKSLEHFYWGHVRAAGDDVSDALDSVLAYERWMAERDPELLRQIEAYNRRDVESTAALHHWLEARRAELTGSEGPLPRPTATLDEPQPVGELEQAEQELAQRLRAVDQPLLAGLVQWHRREGRPRWWDIFRLKDLDDDQLERDRSALGGLSAPTAFGVDKRSTLWRYTFPPQETRLGEGKTTRDADTAETVGEVVAIDAADGWLVLKVGPDKPAPRCRGLGPSGPPGDQVLRDAIGWTAQRTLAHEDTPGQRLLDRVVPAALPVPADESPAAAVIRVGRGLDGQVLAVQGPPGSGKTTVGAELIRALLDDGKRVGVTAQSHQVIGNLLRAVGRPALQKCSAGEHCGGDGVAWTASNDDVVDGLASGDVSLVGGTAWLWARPDLRAALDVLVVEEAGQFSLANAVAVAGAAHSMVLLGDPQQLHQPTQAVHPDGAGASALGHLLAGHETIPPECGLFLDRSWRMHPRITAFVSDLAYEGRLRAAPGRERQAVTAPGPLTGSGLRFAPVEHRHNSAGSDEEVAVVADLLVGLTTGRWTDHTGAGRPLTLGDVLVVAPYNNQVGRLRRGLPSGARVGTVDKFQGQEAPVVVYSMASSSARDAPRGVGFLYDLARLNVAVSRAQALAVIVASPQLLDAEVRSATQLRKVNALCRYVELAEPVVAPVALRAAAVST